MELKTPIHLKSEHEGFLAEIRTAGKLGGRTGKAALLVERLLERHFALEDEFVFPPLGLLPALAQDLIEPEMAAAVAMTDKLHDEMGNLLAVQRTIVGALEELMAVAEEEGHAELVGFAENLMLHEEMERDIAYPASILIGKYLKLKLKT
jgi:hypothetical protein